MLALAYDAALCREELCALRTDDLDPAHRTLRVASSAPVADAIGGLMHRPPYRGHRRTPQSVARQMPQAQPMDRSAPRSWKFPDI
jgi:hypothetical protein